MKSFAAGVATGLIVVYLIVLLILTSGVVRASTHFYVRSESNGYSVCIDHGHVTVCIGKPFIDPTDANIIVKELNRDMEGNWEK
jgi:uncharacterized membrane protein HdeD (DUF308 family)